MGSVSRPRHLTWPEPDMSRDMSRGLCQGLGQVGQDIRELLLGSTQTLSKPHDNNAEHFYLTYLTCNSLVNLIIYLTIKFVICLKWKGFHRKSVRRKARPDISLVF